MKITSLIKGSLAAFIMLFTLAASAQNTVSSSIDKQVVRDLNKTPNMALGLTEERHIQEAFKFFNQMLVSEVKLEKFEIVIWGKVVKNLKEDSELYRAIEVNQHSKLQVSVCEVAMERLGVAEDELPEGATPVSNAFLRLLQIQASGYNVIVP